MDKEQQTLTPEEMLDKLRKMVPSVEQLATFNNALARVRNDVVHWRHKRSTLTYSNARLFLPYILALIENPADGIDIPQKDFPTAKLRTLYLKWMGALQYFIEAPDDEYKTQQQACAMIKATFVARLDVKNNCLAVRPRGAVDYSPKKHFNKAYEVLRAMDSPKASEWKGVFLEWVASGEVGVPLVIKNLQLTEADVEFVRTMCEEQGWECSVNLLEIRAVKI